MEYYTLMDFIQSALAFIVQIFQLILQLVIQVLSFLLYVVQWVVGLFT
jgi:hypothetical protein